MARFPVVVVLAIACAVVTAQQLVPDGAVALPSPTVAFKVNPNITRKTQYFPTCHPTVVDTFTAFWCYYDLEILTNFAGVVSPSSPSIQYPTMKLRASEAYLDITPLPISETSALFGSNEPATSSWGAATTNAILGPENRYNSTTTPAVDPVAHKVFIPFGVHNGEDILTAIDLTEVNHPIVDANSTWRHAAADNGLSLLHDVIAYEGFLFFMHNNSFYKMNATTMSLTGGFVVKDPCNIGLRARDGMNLKLVTYGQDIHGPLNAFIVYGNTTNETHAEFTMCRVSHITGQQKWNKTILDDFVVEDITGGAGSVMLLSGYAASTTVQMVTLVSSVLNGKTYGSVLRKDQDEGTYPVFVPTGIVKPPNGSTVACGPAFVLQVAGAATAYCVAPFVVYNHPVTPAWTAKGYPCAHYPAFDPVTSYLVCISPGNFVAALTATTGAAVWIDTQNMYMTRPQIINDGGASYVFLSDLDSTLWGFKMALPPPPPTPAPPITHPVTSTPAPGGSTPAPLPTTTTAAPTTPTPTANTGGGGGSSGLTGGQAAGVTIGVILAVGIAALIAIVYYRRTKRRQGYKAQQTAINEYGSVS